MTRLILLGHDGLDEALAYLDAHSCPGELDELVVDHALSRLTRSSATCLLQKAAGRVRPGGLLVVRDLALLAASGLIAEGQLDGEAALTDRRSFWTPDQAAGLLPPDFRLLSRRVTGGGEFEVTLKRVV